MIISQELVMILEFPPRILQLWGFGDNLLQLPDQRFVGVVGAEDLGLILTDEEGYRLEQRMQAIVGQHDILAIFEFGSISPLEITTHVQLCVFQVDVRATRVRYFEQIFLVRFRSGSDRLNRVSKGGVYAYEPFRFHEHVNKSWVDVLRDFLRYHRSGGRQ
jgi:hypothetical protein